MITYLGYSLPLTLSSQVFVSSLVGTFAHTSFQRWTHQDPPSSDSDWPWTWWYIKQTNQTNNDSEYYPKYGTNRVPYWFKTGRAVYFTNTGRFRILRDGWQLLCPALPRLGKQI